MYPFSLNTRIYKPTRELAVQSPETLISFSFFLTHMLLLFFLSFHCKSIYTPELSVVSESNTTINEDGDDDDDEETILVKTQILKTLNTSPKSKGFGAFEEKQRHAFQKTICSLCFRFRLFVSVR